MAKEVFASKLKLATEKKLSRLVRNEFLQLIPPHVYQGHSLGGKGARLETEKVGVVCVWLKGKRRRKKKKRKKKKRPT